MPPARFRRIALAGFALLGACNDTRDLAPASPDTPWQFEPSKEAPAALAPAAVGARRFAVPENTAVQLPSPADIDPNHVYSLVELIDIAQRRNPSTRVAWEQARQAAINVGIAREFLLPNDPKPMTVRFDVINLFDTVYLIRDGTGIGVFAPQYGPRRGFYAGVSKKF